MKILAPKSPTPETIEEINQYMISQETRDIIGGRGDYWGHHRAYWRMVNKFGRDGVHWLEASAMTNPIVGVKKEAAELVASEWRDRHSARANMLLTATALAAAVASVFSAIAAWSAG